MVKTYAILAGRYRGRSTTGATLTHAYDTRTGLTLCRKFSDDSLTESGDDDLEATCPTCAKRDPRSKTGGPFSLSSILQFR